MPRTSFSTFNLHLLLKDLTLISHNEKRFD